MSHQQQWRFRLGLLSELVELAPHKLGRTAIMKLAYFLQTLKGVPFGYDFRLYTYGPFDSRVLDDLGQAETLGAVSSEMITYPSGYGYEFSPGPNRAKVKHILGEELTSYHNEIRWALAEFGDKQAADLELLTTIVYADQEAARRGQRVRREELARTVQEIKPHFSESYILQSIKSLKEKALLVAVEESEPPSA